jgi:uncharacterized protein YndB with AHSA1/START domain
MGREFAHHHEAEVPATPEEIWAAIATGPGIDSWFMGRNDVKAGLGGTVRTVFAELEINGWDPDRRLAYRSGEAPDGRFIAYEFLIEGQAGGSTVLRTVTSGFLPGEDWAEEFEAMRLGVELHFATLAAYLTYFAGRFATPVTAFGPPGTSWPRDRASLCRELGLTDSPAAGDPVQLAGEVGPAGGTVYFANAHAIGVRTPDALYRIMRGFARPVIAAHHLFGADAEPEQAQRAWEAWLARTLA